jgi:hypothetical protein
VLASVPTSTAARLIDSGRKPWKVPNYWPYAVYAVSLSGQGQVVSATLIADVGNECLGSAGRTRAGRSHWFLREKEVVRDVDRFRRRGITEEE